MECLGFEPGEQDGRNGEILMHTLGHFDSLLR